METASLFTRFDDGDALETALDALISEAGTLDDLCFTSERRECDDMGASPRDSKVCDGGGGTS